MGLEQIRADWHLLSFAAKWLHSNDVVYVDQSKAKDIENDTALLKQLHSLLDQADVVICHNAKRFDIPKINARLILQGFGPPSPYKIVDTLEIAKRNFKFTSNRLAYLSEVLCNTKKSEHKKFPGFTLWKECLAGNASAWQEMKSYNIKDIAALEELYLKLRAWDKNHPSMTVYSADEKLRCNKCGSDKVERRGFAFTQVGKYQRYQCKACASWSRGASSVNTKEERQALLR